MDLSWEQIFENIRKEIEEALSGLFKNTFNDVEKILQEAKNKAEELVKSYTEKINEEYINNQLNESIKNVISAKTEELNELLQKQKEEIQKEFEGKKSEVLELFNTKLKEIETQLNEYVAKALDPQQIRETLDERIKRFIEEETHIFEEELKRLSSEVLEKNQKDIRKNIEKTLKNLYESEDGLKKIVQELVKNNSDFITDQLKEKISEIVSKSAKDLLLESPLAERIAEVVGFEMRKYFKEIQDLRSALEVLEVKFKILAESPSAVAEKDEQAETQEEHLPTIELFPRDEGVQEEELKPVLTDREIEKGSAEPNIIVEAVEEKLEVPQKESERPLKLETPIKITFLGHAAFIIESKGIKILTDPYKHMALNNSIKYAPIDVETDFVTVSHAHMDQGAWKEIPGNPRLVEVEGEKTFAEFPFLRFKGIHTYHDNAEGNVRGSNMVFNIEIAGVRITHLGALGHILTKEQIREIGRPVDILFIPVGGYDTLPIKDAWEVVYQIEPSIVIPMRFKTDACDLPLAEVDAFTSLAKCPVKLFESTVTIEEIPPSMEVWVLKPAKLI
ncbi:MAG: MBL fold metallo-hydrolase [candidate division WOR-3 bacterium]